MAALGPALEQNPHDADLRVALGHVRFAEGDYPAAYAEAQAVLKRDPTNKQAMALKLYTQGRSKGAVSAASLPASGLEEACILQDPRIVEAGRRALARQSAVGYADEAMRRIKIRDPQEALRYLSLAEAVDPSYADVPMQQGIAHKALRQHAAAIERFTRAEALWSLENTPDAAKVAAIARQQREEESAALARMPALVAEVPRPPERKMPLWLVGAALAAVGFGAWVILEKRREEDALRGAIETYGPAGLVIAGAALAAASFIPSARPALQLRSVFAVAREAQAVQALAPAVVALPLLMKGGGPKPGSPGADDLNERPADAGQVKPKKGDFLEKLRRVKSKGQRTRWVDENGRIHEWDSQHGELEVYDRRGKHLGVRDPDTGEWVKPARAGREIEP